MQLRDKVFWVAGSVAVSFAMVKVVAWWPLRSLFFFPGMASFIKAIGTVAIAWPVGGLGSTGSMDKIALINDETYMVDDATHPELVRLLEKYPLSPEILDSSRPPEIRLSELAAFVSLLLPINSRRRHYPEPVSALEILGDGDGEPYPKLCSKDSKIFVQYANALGFSTRLLQLHHHIAAGVFNPVKQKWEMYDPYFGCAPQKNGEFLSSTEAFELYARGQPFDFCGSKSVFQTVVTIPRTNFASGSYPRWHYFNYENLAFWRPHRLSSSSDEIWQRRLAPKVWNKM